MRNWGCVEDEAGVAGRRAFLAGVGATALLTLPGCQSVGQLSYTEAIRRLLVLASQSAFAQLTQPDGFWNNSVARINLPVLFGRTGGILKGVLQSNAFREELQHQLNRYAEDGARRAAPLVAEASRNVSIADALGILKAGPTAATSLLRAQMGPALVNAMIPELGRVMDAANDPLLGRAIGALTGVNLGDAAHALALEADNAIWYAIGAEESRIRRDPASTNDPVLIAALAAAG